GVGWGGWGGRGAGGQKGGGRGGVSRARRGHTRDYAIREVSPDEAGPVLQRYVRLAPSARPYFEASKDSPVEDFVAEADRHPVFELMPAGEDHQLRHRER